MKNILGNILLSGFIFVFFMFGTATVAEGSNNEQGGKPGQILQTTAYNCGSDTCMGYRCVGNVNISEGISVSPACYNSAELAKRNCKSGQYQYMPSFQNVCSQANYYYVWTK